MIPFADQRIRRASRTWRRTLLLLGLIAFTVVTAAAIRNLPTPPNPVRWSALVVVGVLLVPVTIVTNGVEFQLTARFLGRRIAIMDAIQTALLSSAANLLPVPGSLLVRARRLSAEGADLSHATRAPLLVGILWLGVAAATAGFWVAATTGQSLASIVGASGGALAVAALILLARSAPSADRPFGSLLAVEIVLVIVSSFRNLLILRGLGFESGLDDGLALALSGVLAAAVGVIPGGLGIREAISAVLSPLVGMTAAAGALAAAIDRVIGLIVLGIVGAAIVLRSRRRDGRPGEQGSSGGRTAQSSDDTTTVRSSK